MSCAQTQFHAVTLQLNEPNTLLYIILQDSTTLKSQNVK